MLEKLVPQCTGIDVTARHGSIIMVAEVVHALDEIETKTGQLSLLSKNSRLREVFRVVKVLKDGNMFRGVSGEHMRAACSHLIARLSQCSSNLSIPRPTNDSWTALIHDTLSHLHHFNNSEEICQLAISALSAMNDVTLAAAPFVTIAASPEKTDASLIDQSIQQYLGCLRSETESTRSGYAQAIGSLPKPVIQGRLMVILEGLFRATQITNPSETSFAYARRDAINALTRVCLTVGVAEKANSGLCADNVDAIFAEIFRGLDDYTRDSRGDVGSHVRGAAVAALHDIASLVAHDKAELLSGRLVEAVMKKLLRQACEKLHNIRQAAVESFVSLLYHEKMPAIPHVDALLAIFPRGSKHFNLTELFKRLTQTLELEKYAYEALFGLMISVGDLTQSLAEASGQALLSYMNSIREDEQKVKGVLANLTLILRSHSKNKRVSIPFLKTINQLLVNDCFEALNTAENVDIHAELIAQIKTEILRTKDAHKVLLSVPVFCNMLFLTEPSLRSKVLSQLMVFLCHRFPIVRKTAATQLYEQLMMYSELIEAPEQLEVVLAYLVEVEWDQEEVTALRPKRNEMCGFFGVPVPQVKKKVDNK